MNSLRHQIEHAAHLLPSQGPITVFVHHNTLHAFEEQSFEQGVLAGTRIFGCQPYLPEDRYRQLLGRDRIREVDLLATLTNDLQDRAGESIVGLASRLDLRLAMLRHPLRMASSAELRWLIAETDALRRFRDDVPDTVREPMVEETRHWVMRDLRNGHDDPVARRAKDALADLFQKYGEASVENWSVATWQAFSLHALWRACRQGVHGLTNSAAAPPPSVRHRDLLFEATGADSDDLVHEVLIRFCGAFLDQGLATWPLPNRKQGLYRTFCELYRQGGGPPDRWLRGLRSELARLDEAGIGPLESLAESLQLLGVSEDERDRFLSETLLALRGWSGMIWEMETRGDRVPHPAPPGSLVEFLAVRLILERLALAFIAREKLGYNGPLSEFRKTVRSRLPRREAHDTEHHAFQMFQVAQFMGWRPLDLFRLTKPEWTTLLGELESFSALERRRVFQIAYERRYRVQALDAFSVHGRRSVLPRKMQPRPRFQWFCCIDDREAAFRRHLEEVAPDVETFGTAGYFGVAMYFRGATEAHFTPLCPIMVRPKHWVVEGVPYPLEDGYRRRKATRRVVGAATHRVHLGSRTFFGGALTALFGSLATAPLVGRVLFPRFTAQLRQWFGRIVEPPTVRQLILERHDPTPGPEEGHLGYSLPEMAGIVTQLLKDIGLTSNFARLIIVTGHGSSSVNNPHESAYNCGACSGGRGGPNARAFSQMANDPRVRRLIAEAGLEIPQDTVFVGAYHNTCNDSVTYFDLDRLPHSHRNDFERATQDVEESLRRNAHERCRRFESAPLDLPPEAALRHVEERSEDLSQPRPEYNHATNALTFVGRRGRTRGLFLDRRAFLSCYDPTQDDPEHTTLARVLQPVVPVCAGIALEYYFSTVDPNGYGSNNKLPHNVASMLGVMLGAASDLQPGLNQQMIEIHEPLRHLFIVETTPQAMLSVMDRNVDIGRLVRNGWVWLATLDPNSETIHEFRNGRFEKYTPETTELPEVNSSLDWYRGWRDHLGFAAVRGPNVPAASESPPVATAGH